jgi:hypothetical protein
MFDTEDDTSGFAPPPVRNYIKSAERTPLQIPPLRTGQSRMGQWLQCRQMVAEAVNSHVQIAQELVGRFAVAAVIEQSRGAFGLAALPDHQAHQLAFDAATHIAQNHRGELKHLVFIQDHEVSQHTLAVLARWQADTGCLVFEATPGTSIIGVDKRATDAATCCMISDEFASHTRRGVPEPDVEYIDDDGLTAADFAEELAARMSDPTDPMHDDAREAEADAYAF